jgi:apolipoprotein N-acyltransferase
MWMHRYQRHALAIGLGILQAVALSDPAGGALSALLQLLSMVGLLVIIRQGSTFQTAWLFATSWLCATVWWLYIALHTFGQLPAPLTILAIVLLCGGLAVYYAASIWLYQWSQPSCHPVLQGLVFAACWTAAEMARAQWFTGFPWGAIGYAHVDGRLSHLAPFIGVYGIGFAAALLSAWMVSWWSGAQAKWRWLCLSGLVVVLPNSLPMPEEELGKVSVALLQGNIPQDLKFASGRQDALHWYQEQLLQSQAQVTVLPETAIPYFKEELPTGYWDAINNTFASGEKVALMGMPTRDPAKGFGNSVIALGLDEGPKQYNKHHLVPFGEFTPDTLKWFTRMLRLDFADFNRGEEGPLPMAWKGQQLAVNICYEDLFGEELAKSFVREAGRTPTVMVNVSNIAWFGDTVVIPQHLQIARMRSMEFKTPTIRATNSGGTAIINAQGVITHQLTPYTRGVLKGDVASQAGTITPFAFWAGHWGLKPLWAICLGIMLWAATKTWRSRKGETALADQ